MTPKEKAQELVDKFTVVGLQQRNEGIQCALICVEEMLQIASLNKLIYHYTEDGATILGQWPERVYWWVVKKEIENL
jgi:hypothetical protein